MKRLAIALAVVLALGIVGAVAVASHGLGSGWPLKKELSVTKNGQTKMVIGEKPDPASIDPVDTVWGYPEYYHTAPFEWSAPQKDKQDIEKLLRDTYEKEAESMVDSNKSMAQEYKDKLSDSFSDRNKVLSKHKQYIDANQQMNQQDGFGMVEFKITRFEVMSLVVDGDSAHAIAEEETYAVNRRYKPQPDAETEWPVVNGRQLELKLERTDGKWLITAERWVFIPGMEP